MVQIADYSGQRIHMIGIGGSSMSGLAEILLSLGYIVSGSDISQGHYTQKLVENGALIRIGHHPDMVDGAVLVVYSAAISKEDPEMLRADALSIPKMERAVLLGQLMSFYKKRVCISGTHGKTTTTAMIAQAAMDLGLQPGVHIGGRIKSLDESSFVGEKDVYIAEACEFNRSFLHMHPSVALFLNLDAEHLDCYEGSFDCLKAAFQEFLEQVPQDGLVIYNAEDENCLSIIKNLDRPKEGFGFSQGQWQARNIRYDAQGRPSFDVFYGGSYLSHLSLKVMGEFNVLHALASLAALRYLGADLQKSCEALSLFGGVGRRNEYTGTVKGMQLFHDYGHNAQEMAAAISVARRIAPRLIAVMQPHTFSRVINSFSDIAACTKLADITLVSDICPAREKDPGTISSQMLVAQMRKNGIDAQHTPSFDDIERWLLENGHEGDVVLTMGCGDINDLNIQMQTHWDNRTEDR